MSYINSTTEEKNAIIAKIKELRRSLIDSYDCFASPNEDLFYFAKIKLEATPPGLAVIADISAS